MEIAYSKHIPNDEYFIINKINGVFSPNIDIISSNLYDIKRIDYKGKMLVYLFFKINGLTNEKEINNALKQLNLKSNILRTKMSDLSDTELIKILTITLLLNGTKTIIIKNVDSYFNTRELVNYFRFIKNILEKRDKTVIFESLNYDNVIKYSNNYVIVENNKIKRTENINELNKKTELMKITDLANDKNSKIPYYKDVNDLLKAIYRSVTEKK